MNSYIVLYNNTYLTVAAACTFSRRKIFFSFRSLSSFSLHFTTVQHTTTAAATATTLWRSPRQREVQAQPIIIEKESLDDLNHAERVRSLPTPPPIAARYISFLSIYTYTYLLHNRCSFLLL